MARKYLGNYLGIVIMNTDYEKRGRCKIWVPHVSVTVYENWNKDKLDKNFIFPDKENAEDLDKILPELKRILPWAECAMPLFGGNAPGRYFGLDRVGTSSDSNYWKDDTYIEGKRPSEIFKQPYPDAFSEVNNVGNRFVNPHAYQYKPGAYSNLARGMYTIPNVGAHVWVFFQDGDPKYPVYFAAAAGEEDWKRIYTLNQNTKEDVKDFGSPDYPQSFENVNVEDGGFLNTDTKTFRSKTVFNSNKHTIELIDTDLREIMKFTHYSGSFLEFNNYTTSQLAAGNDQKLVIGDQFLTVKKNQSIFVQDHVDQIIGGDHFRTIGQFDKSVVLDIYDILKDIHDRKRLFEIKRSASTVDDNGTCGEVFENANGVSPLQSKAGGPAPCPTCCAGKTYHIVKNICDEFVCLPCSTNLIVPGVHLIEDKDGACGTKWVLPCKTCCGTGLSPSTQDGAWAADGLKQSLAGYIEGKQMDLFPLQRKLGNGGNEIVSIHGNKTETIGQVFNDFAGWRKDPTGKIRVAGCAVDYEGTYAYMRPAPIVESVDVDHLPGGDLHVTASNQYRLLVGGGGVQIKTFGNIDMYGGIISIAGEQLTLSSKGEVLVNGKERTSLQGKHISINPDNYEHAVVNGGLGVTRQLIVNGATHMEGELYLHHITAPLEYQTTECADSLKCSTLIPCIPVAVSPTPPIAGGGALDSLGGACTPDPTIIATTNASIAIINANFAALVAWLNQHTHLMPHVQHFHYFKNVPLDLYDTSFDVRKDACDAGINNTEQMPAKPVRTPIPNVCMVPAVCPGVPPIGPCAESFRIVAPDNAVSSGEGVDIGSDQAITTEGEHIVTDHNYEITSILNVVDVAIPEIILSDWPTVVASFNTTVNSSVIDASEVTITEQSDGSSTGSGSSSNGDVSISSCASATDIIFILDSTTDMENTLTKIYDNIDYFSQRLTNGCLEHRFGGITFGDNYGMTHTPRPGKTPAPLDQVRPIIAPTSVNVFKTWLNDVINNHIVGGDDLYNNAIDPLAYAMAASGAPVTTNPEGSYCDDTHFDYYDNVAYILVTDTGFNTPLLPGNTDNWYASGGSYNSPIYNTYTDIISALQDKEIPCYSITTSIFNKSEYKEIAQETSAGWYELSTVDYSDIFRPLAASICNKYGGCPPATDIIFLLDSTTPMLSSLTSLYFNMEYFASQLSSKCVDFKFGGITFGNNYGTTHLPLPGYTPDPMDQPRSFIAPTELGSVTATGTFMNWLSTAVIEKVIGDNDTLHNPIDTIDYALASPLLSGTNPEGSYRDQAGFSYRTNVVYILLTNTGFNTPSAAGNANCWYTSGGSYNSSIYNTYTDIIDNLKTNEIRCYTITDGAYDGSEADKDYNTKYRTISKQSNAIYFDIPSDGFAQGYKPILQSIAYDIKGKYKASYVSSAPSGSIATVTISVTSEGGFTGSNSTTYIVP